MVILDIIGQILLCIFPSCPHEDEEDNDQDESHNTAECNASYHPGISRCAKGTDEINVHHTSFLKS